MEVGWLLREQAFDLDWEARIFILYPIYIPTLRVGENKTEDCVASSDSVLIVKL